MKRLVILGAAESGVGAAILGAKKGYEVFVSDAGAIKDKYKAMLAAHSLRWEEGTHTEAEILRATEVIKSPGIPDNAPMIVKLRAAGIPVISDIEFASRYTAAKMICITGSNGKTTTTSLVYHILQKAGLDVGLAGNIGRSFALQVAEGERDYYVLELSSFQLDDMYDFRAHVAVLLNITPDHLDRYDYDMQKYTDSKMRITRNQTADDTFIYWNEDPVVSVELPKYPLAARRLAFTDLDLTTAAAYSDGRALHTQAGFTMPLDKVLIKGRHNVRNALAAILAAQAAGVSDKSIADGLYTFTGVEHRLEPVRTVDGVSYINDSKATNVDACYYALDSMTAPTVLIIGGKDKGNDYNEIKELVRKKCRAIVYLGADNAKLHAFFAPLGLPTADTHSMPECIEACRRLAHSGDTVLLSPCCASFDLFRNMEDRGEQFKTLVRALP